MFLLKSAWDNIKFHKKRSILSILLITIASAAILLYRGFVEYSEQGMAIGFIQESGHLQVALKDFWNKKNTADMILTAHDMNKLKDLFDKTPEIVSSDAVLNFQGIIRTQNSSSIFCGAGYDEPHSLGAPEGVPVFEGDNSLVLDKALFNSLGLDLENNNYVNIMTAIGEKKIETGSFEVSGTIDIGTPQNAAGFLIASRKDILDFFGMEDAASYIRLYLKNNQDIKKIENKLNSVFKENNLNFEVKNWKTLNPSWQQVSDLFNAQFIVISGILYVLIFTALTQSLSASFMERIGEFGTMEAIGLKKSMLISILILEVCILSIAGIIGGILLSQAGNIITQIFDIKMNPPGSTSYYLLNFFITAEAVIKTQIFIFFTALISVIYPIYTIKKYSSIKLINYNIS